MSRSPFVPVSRTPMGCTTFRDPALPVGGLRPALLSDRRARGREGPIQSNPVTVSLDTRQKLTDLRGRIATWPPLPGVHPLPCSEFHLHGHEEAGHLEDSPGRAAQAARGRALQRLRRVLSGRALPHGCLVDPAHERALPVVAVACRKSHLPMRGAGIHRPDDAATASWKAQALVALTPAQSGQALDRSGHWLRLLDG